MKHQGIWIGLMIAAFVLATTGIIRADTTGNFVAIGNIIFLGLIVFIYIIVRRAKPKR